MSARVPVSAAERRSGGWSLRWKVFGAFVLVSVVAPLLAAGIGQRVVLRTLEVQSHARLVATARGIAGQLGRTWTLQYDASGAPATAAADTRLHDVVVVAAEATGAVVAVAGEDGVVLVSFPRRRDVTAMGPAIREVLSVGHVQCAMPSKRCGLPTPFHVRTVLGGYPIRVAGVTVGAVVLASPVREVQAAALFPQKVFFESWMFGIALSLLLGLVLAGGITRPLRAMAQAAEGISRGDFRHRVPPGPRDEIGLLAAAFNRMAGRLERVLAARRDLLAAVSHELRTPLTSIQGFVQALRDGVVDEEAVERTYGIIDEEIARLRRLIEDLFELAKLEAGQVTLRLLPCAAAELVESAAERGRALIGRDGPVIALDVAGDAGVLRADPDRIFQVLSNLVQNALRFTPAQGRITLRARGWEPGAPAGGERVRFEVEDTGVGIAPEDVEHIFERFYTVDRSRSRPNAGTGLGLAIAREIVRAHGGTISVESRVGQGSTFRIDLPRSGPRAAEVPPPQATSAAGRRGRRG